MLERVYWVAWVPNTTREQPRTVTPSVPLPPRAFGGFSRCCTKFKHTPCLAVRLWCTKLRGPKSAVLPSMQRLCLAFFHLLRSLLRPTARQKRVHRSLTTQVPARKPPGMGLDSANVMQTLIFVQRASPAPRGERSTISSQRKFGCCPYPIKGEA